MYGICNLSIAPCRRDAADSSEMVTQLLFGDCFQIIEQVGSWCKIIVAYDEYECWIDEKQFTTIDKATFEILNTTDSVLCNELVQVISNDSTGEITPIILGTTFPFYASNHCNVGKEQYTYDGDLVSLQQAINKSMIVETAMMYLNAPYLWGGKSPFGIDCSGLTQMVYKLNGVKIPRDASQQVLMGETLNFVEEAEAGDLAFFDNEEGNIVHVGIVMEENKIIHASGKVRIDGFDHQGIFNKEKNNYSHRLRILKKVL